jgi:hypothetical protein
MSMPLAAVTAAFLALLSRWHRPAGLAWMMLGLCKAARGNIKPTIRVTPDGRRKYFVQTLHVSCRPRCSDWAEWAHQTTTACDPPALSSTLWSHHTASAIRCFARWTVFPEALDRQDPPARPVCGVGAPTRVRHSL